MSKALRAAFHRLVQRLRPFPVGSRLVIARYRHFRAACPVGKWPRAFTARRSRVAAPDLDFREFCRRSKLPQSERSWDLFAGERYRRGETDIPSDEAYNPFRHRQQGPYA